MDKNDRFYNFIEQIRPNVSFYDLYDVMCKSDSFYDLFPCTSKKDIIDNYDCCIDKRISCIDGVVDKISETNDLSRDHDKIICVNNERIKVETTSGTTGKAVPILKTSKTMFAESKYLMKCRKQHDNRIMTSNGLLLYHSMDTFIRNLDLSYNADNASNFGKILTYYTENKDSIRWLFTTVLQAHKIHSFLESDSSWKDKCRGNNLAIWETTSQAMNKEESRNLSNIFNTRFVNNYGCREAWNIAYECKHGHLHINDNYLIVDVVDDNGNVVSEDGGYGKIIITHLLNIESPLVKYYTGDYGRIYRNHNCKCGQRTPILQIETGRTFEKIKHTNFYGNDIFRRVLRGIYFHEHNREYDDVKIVQKDKKITIYVKGNISDDFKRVFVELSEFLLRTMEFEYEFIGVQDLG